MKVTAVLAVTLLSLIAIIPAASSDGAADDGLLRIYEVIPYGDSEGFSLFNYGIKDVDLSGYYAEDGEGTVRFASSVILHSKCSVTILKDRPEKWMRFERIMIHGSDGIVANNFQLNDKGDEIVLKTVSGETVDVFVYGTGSWDSGWTGEPFGNINYGKTAKRTYIFDTDSKDDWELVIPGRTSFGVCEFAADITPFVFPDSEGIPVMDALADAKRDIVISVYILDHYAVASVLKERLENGVSVSILFEGSPSGGVPDAELGYMSALHRAGAEIYVMKNAEGFRRYSYLHNKYAVIDSETVVMTSENWRAGSFTDNRGWGAIIRSEEYGRFMTAVFEDDASSEYGDVVTFGEIYGNVIPSKVPAFSVPDVPYESIHGTVFPVIGPDNALGQLNSLISSSQHRIYSEQMAVDADWIHGATPLNAMTEASSRGVDCRLIVDVTFDSPYDDNGNDGFFLKEELSMRVKTSDECSVTGMIHNKGVVADDSVWIGSMNWNDSSFSDNREAGVIIMSSYAADIFASYFLSDWNGFEGTVSITADVEGSPGRIILDASGSFVPDGSVFRWDLDNDGTADREGIKIVADIGPGRHVCRLIVTLPDGETHEHEFAFTIQSETDLPWYIIYIPIVFPCIMIIAYRIFRTLRDNDDTRVP